MHLRRDALLSAGPVLVLLGLAIMGAGLIWIVELVGEAHDIEYGTPDTT